MTLANALALLMQEIEIEKSTQGQYLRAVARLDEYLGRPSTIDDLTPPTINAWLAWLGVTHGYGPCTILNYRAGILRVWGYCADVLEIAPPCLARRIRRPKQPQKIVRAWSLEQLELLSEAALSLPGQLKCGIPGGLYMHTRVWVGYDTGLRPIDLRAMEWSSVDLAAETITIVQHKTGELHVSNIGSESVEGLKKMLSYGQPRVFPLNKYGATRWERIMYQRAEKLGFSRAKLQGIGTLRKTHATEICRVEGLSAAAASLGHKSGTAIAQRHYVDSRLQQGRLPPRPARRA